MWQSLRVFLPRLVEVLLPLKRNQEEINCGKRSGLMVSALVSGSSGPGS